MTGALKCFDKIATVHSGGPSVKTHGSVTVSDSIRAEFH